MDYRKKNCDAFTLVELMIASAIFLLASTGFTLGLISALRTQHMADYYYQSMCIARNRIQRARTLTFSNIAMLSESDQLVDRDGNAVTDGRFKRTTTVTYNSSASNCLDIVTQVYFSKRDGSFSDAPVMLSTKIATGM